MKSLPFRRGSGASHSGCRRPQPARLAVFLVAVLLAASGVEPPCVEAALVLPALRLRAAPDASLLAVAQKKPEGAPVVEVLFVAWSPDPSRRLASLRVNGKGTTIVREGQYVDGTMLKVLNILRDGLSVGFYAEAYQIPAKRH